MNPATCTNCGNSLSRTTKFCARCGTPASTPIVTPPTPAAGSGAWATATAEGATVPHADPASWPGRGAPGPVAPTAPGMAHGAYAPSPTLATAPPNAGASVTPRRFSSGIPGGVAFGVSIVCVQAWAAIMFGLALAYGADWFSDTTSSDSWSSVSTETTNDVLIEGIITMGIGAFVLLAVIAFMRGNRVGQAICAVTEGLVAVYILYQGSQWDAMGLAFAMSAFPIIALLCLVSSSANHLIIDAAATLPQPVVPRPASMPPPTR